MIWRWEIFDESLSLLSLEQKLQNHHLQEKRWSSAPLFSHLLLSLDLLLQTRTMYGIANRRQKSTSSTSSNDRKPKKSSSQMMSRGASRGDYPAVKKVSMPGVVHPQTGQMITPYSVRCACGGVTGKPGTKWGNAKYASHQQTQQHVEWSKANES
jgi:hypothetical protein